MSRYLRTRSTEEEQHASNLELFYDLVFVLAITQVSHLLLGDLTWREQPFRAALTTYLHGRGHDRPPQIRLTARIVASHPSGTRTLG